MLRRRCSTTTTWQTSIVKHSTMFFPIDILQRPPPYLDPTQGLHQRKSQKELETRRRSLLRSSASFYVAPRTAYPIETQPSIPNTLSSTKPLWAKRVDISRLSAGSWRHHVVGRTVAPTPCIFLNLGSGRLGAAMGVTGGAWRVKWASRASAPLLVLRVFLSFFCPFAL